VFGFPFSEVQKEASSHHAGHSNPAKKMSYFLNTFKGRG
jgi:hypothetical protein